MLASHTGGVEVSRPAGVTASACGDRLFVCVTENGPRVSTNTRRLIDRRCNKRPPGVENSLRARMRPPPPSLFNSGLVMRCYCVLHPGGRSCRTKAGWKLEALGSSILSPKVLTPASRMKLLYIYNLGPIPASLSTRKRFNPTSCRLTDTASPGPGASSSRRDRTAFVLIGLKQMSPTLRPAAAGGETPPEVQPDTSTQRSCF